MNTKYYIDTQTNTIKIYKEINNVVYNNILFSTYKDAKFYFNYIKDTIFESFNYTNTSDYRLRTYSIIKKQIETLEKEINSIDSIIKQHPDYVNGFFNSNEWLDREKESKKYNKILNEKRLLIIKHKSELAKYLKSITNLNITAGSTTIDRILTGKYNNIPLYLKTKHIERFTHNYTNDLITFESKEKEVLNDYQKIVDYYDKNSINIFKEKKKIVKKYLKLVSLNNNLNKLLLNIMLDIPNQNFFCEFDISEFPYNEITFIKESLSYNIFAIYNNKTYNIAHIYEKNNSYYLFTSEGLLPSKKYKFYIAKYKSNYIDLDKNKKVTLGNDLQ